MKYTQSIEYKAPRLPVRMWFRAIINTVVRHAEREWFNGLLWGEQSMSDVRVWGEQVLPFITGHKQYNLHWKHRVCPVIRENLKRPHRHDAGENYELGVVRVISQRWDEHLAQHPVEMPSDNWKYLND